MRTTRETEPSPGALRAAEKALEAIVVPLDRRMNSLRVTSYPMPSAEAIAAIIDRETRGERDKLAAALRTVMGYAPEDLQAEARAALREAGEE